MARKRNRDYNPKPVGDDGILEPFGPDYPNMPSLAKYRRRKNETPEQAKEYGEAVCAAIRALQRSEIMREVSEPRAGCASRTSHNDGLKILKAVNAQNKASAEALAYRLDRKMMDIEIEYARQIADKREAEYELQKANERALRAAPHWAKPHLDFIAHAEARLLPLLTAYRGLEQELAA